MKTLLPFLAILGLSLAGCADITKDPNPITGGRGTITGQVLDPDDNPVRGATVAAGGKTTTTSASGTYHIDDIGAGIVEVRASVRDEGVNYRGRTYTSLSVNSQRSNVNVILSPEGRQGTITGTVRDREGFLLRNVPVFAYNGAGSAARTYTDDDGEFFLVELAGGYDYEIMATGQGYRSDYDTVFLPEDETRTVNLILGTASNPTLTPPQNFDATTWVSPYPGRSAGGSALEWARVNAFKGELPKGFRPVVSRAIRDDIAVEAVLTWDEQRFADHQGWGIYRGSGTAPLDGLEFNADPLSGFFQDVGLNTNATYRYAATTLSSNFPDSPGQTESALSDVATAITLSRLSLNAIPSGSLTPTLSCPTGSGAEEYVFYVFDQNPIIGVTELWRSPISASRSVTYSGPTLVRGRRYYAFALGLANSRSSRTISEIEEFIP